MTSKQAQALVELAYPQAFEESHRGEHLVYGGSIKRSIIGRASTSAKAWKAAAAHVELRWPNLARTA